jgi:hypothetical protein
MALGTGIRGPNAKWSNEETKSLVDQLQDAKDQGLITDNGFKSVVWTNVGNSYTDPLKTPRSCETKWGRLKKDYKEVKWFKEVSGFGWDNEKHIPIAEPQVWAQLEKVLLLLYLVIIANI